MSNSVTSKQTAAVHPSIAFESSLLARSVEVAEQAAQCITTGAMPAKDCNVLLGSGRLFQSAARQSVANRLAASRLAMQEAKLIEAEQAAA